MNTSIQVRLGTFIEREGEEDCGMANEYHIMQYMLAISTFLEHVIFHRMACILMEFTGGV